MSKIDETTQPDSIRIAAQKLYQSYTANSDNLNFRFEPCPAWADLTPAVRSHWCATAIAAHDLFAPPRPPKVALLPREEAVDPMLAKLGDGEIVEVWTQLSTSGLVEKIRAEVGEAEALDRLVALADSMAHRLILTELA